MLYTLECTRLLLAEIVEFKKVKEKFEALKSQTYGCVFVALMTRYL